MDIKALQKLLPFDSDNYYASGTAAGLAIATTIMFAWLASYFGYGSSVGTKTGKSGKPKGSKKSKTGKTKPKPQKPTDPIELANYEIDEVRKQVELEFELPLTEFLSELEIKRAESEGKLEEGFEATAKKPKNKSRITKNTKKKNKKKEKEAEKAAAAAAAEEPEAEPVKIPYTEELDYKFRYFGEHLLKMLMKLDAVDVQGNEELRAKRKAAIKYIQSFHKKLDVYKPLIENSPK